MTDSADDAPTPEVSARGVARDAGLRYATDARPGWTRRRRGRGFSYHDVEGATISDPESVARVRALAIPPAWTDVWICPWPTGHIQATGRDARGRKQYRYHARWQARRGRDKFERMIAFAEALPALRARCDADLGRPGLSRDKVLATVVMLLERTLIRVGNDTYARDNRSYGLTTMRGRHASVDGTAITFRFRGKSGRMHEVGVRDRRLAGVIRRCQDLPGQELFAYVDEDGVVNDIASDDVNDYIREATGGPFTAKDFRTWAGTLLAVRALRAMAADGEAASTRQAVVEAIKQTADELGNTPAVTRGSYVHPAVLDAYLDGSLGGALVEVAESQATPPGEAGPDDEQAVIDMLRQRLESERRSAARKRARRRTPRGRSAQGPQAASSP